jgi:hypothetical protein
MRYRRLDQVEVERATFPDHHIVRRLIHDRIAILMQGGQQATLSDDERSASRLLSPGLAAGQSRTRRLGRLKLTYRTTLSRQG